jgi:RimJ/RimL family protein N-acetyltransferase
MQHMGRVRLSRAQTRTALRRYARHWEEHGFGLLALADRDTGELVGRAGVQYHYAWPGDPEVGWGLDPDRWGRGLATEAGAACVRWAFDILGKRRLVSICTPENAASRRVMEKLGFALLEEKQDPRLGLVLWVHALVRPQRPRSAGGEFVAARDVV